MPTNNDWPVLLFWPHNCKPFFCFPPTGPDFDPILLGADSRNIFWNHHKIYTYIFQKLDKYISIFWQKPKKLHKYILKVTQIHLKIKTMFTYCWPTFVLFCSQWSRFWPNFHSSGVGGCKSDHSQLCLKLKNNKQREMKEHQERARNVSWTDFFVIGTGWFFWRKNYIVSSILCLFLVLVRLLWTFQIQNQWKLFHTNTNNLECMPPPAFEVNMESFVPQKLKRSIVSRECAVFCVLKLQKTRIK